MLWVRPTHLVEGGAPTAQHIAVVLHDLSTGGSERVAVRLANAWAAAGRHVTLFCGAEDGPLAPRIASAVRVVTVAPRTASKRRRRHNFGRALAGMVAGADPDIVVGPGNYHIPILSAMLDEIGPDRPAVVCKLSNPLFRTDRSRVRQFAFSAAMRRRTRHFDALVAMSPVFAAEATLLTGRRTIACIGEPSLDRLPPMIFPPRPGTGTVLCIGRLVRQKNFALALDAFARSRHARRLVILGSGEEYAALAARADALGIADRVVFAGYVTDVGPWLAQADALLCSSLYEGYPAAMVEALAAGVPIVSTLCSIALPEILVDETFGTVADMRADHVAAALDQVLAERRSPAAAPLAELARRHQLARSAREWLAMLDRTVAVRAEAMA